jgi:hypothetical protein
MNTESPSYAMLARRNERLRERVAELEAALLAVASKGPRAGESTEEWHGRVARARTVYDTLRSEGWS